MTIDYDPQPRTCRIIDAGSVLAIEDICALAYSEAKFHLPRSPEWRSRLQAGADGISARVRRGEKIYGINTGYGDTCDRAVPLPLVEALPHNLVRYHGCGLGELLDAAGSAAVLAVRIASLVKGFSAIRPELLELLTALLNERILPCIPAEGSVGASGDLTPLSYVAAALVGEREVYFEGQHTSARRALEARGLRPLTLAPKEALAIMNGTAVMTALACLAHERARALFELGCVITAMNVVALDGLSAHYDRRLFELKPHPGQVEAAAIIRELLGSASGRAIQDPYSLRCAPHVLGVLEDCLRWSRSWLEIELNSVNDNPLYDPEMGHVMHGGHFYGGHVALAMDSLKTACASVADLLDRQLALLLDPQRNRGLPRNLTGMSGDDASVHHGFKAVHIGASAWAAEALKLTMPATSFSRSTEGHNQDKVSMGTIAARDAIRVLELTEQVSAACLLGSTQALALRSTLEPGFELNLAPGLQAMRDAVHKVFETVKADRPLEGELRGILAEMRRRPSLVSRVLERTTT